MEPSQIAACLEQVVPKLQEIQEPYTLPGYTVEELYTRLCNRRQDDKDIDAVCNIFEQFLALSPEGAIEIVGIFERYLLHLHMDNYQEI